MRAVNLLPEKHRPRKATGGKSGSSYVLLGVLGAIVAGVLVYVMTLNSINSAKTNIAEAKAETTRATAEAEALGPYGDFAKVKKQREDSIKELAQSRLDWERLVRELAHVLPNGVWIRSAAAADSAESAQSLGSGGSSAEEATGPVLSLQGCAVDQNQVADALVRLKTVQGAVDVKLDHSQQGDDPKAGAGSTEGGSASSGDCGLTNGKPNYDFQVAVSLMPTSPTDNEPGRVPARLGGGQ
jgi:Tfp pilus assembly protein PilN